MEAKLAPPNAQVSFRLLSQQLLAQRVQPADVAWRQESAAGPVPVGAAPPRQGPARHGLLPRSFLRIVDLVVLHCDPGRFDLLYRLLWRMVHEPEFGHDDGDADFKRACAMAHAVRREISRHRQKLVFTQLEGAEPLACAWIEPHHHIVEVLAKAAPMPRCLVASPDRAVLCEGGRCEAYGGHWSPPADAAQWRELVRGLPRPDPAP